MEQVIDLLVSAYPALAIAAIGVLAYTVLGWLKNDDSYSLRKASSSAIIAFILGAPLVAAEMSVINWGAVDGYLAIIVVFGLIAQIAGIERYVKNAADIVKKRKRNTDTED